MSLNHSPLPSALLLVALLFQLQGFAQSYRVRELFPEDPFGTIGGRTPERLNNRGEVLYEHLDVDGARPGLWLPRANYGRPAGTNDLLLIASAARGEAAMVRKIVACHNQYLLL